MSACRTLCAHVFEWFIHEMAKSRKNARTIAVCLQRYKKKRKKKLKECII